MRQFLTIAVNAFMELVRQPVFLLLMSASTIFCVFLSCVNYFGFGDEPKLVRNSVLAVMMLSGLFGAVLSASASVAREIRTGTALAVLSKPVGRAQFLVAKFLGLAAVLGLISYINLLGCLAASKMAFDAYGSVDYRSLTIFIGAVAAAYVVGGFSNYFLRRNFVSDATFALVALLTAAFVLIWVLERKTSYLVAAPAVNWQMVPCAVLILFALWILAALALALSTRLDVIPTLSLCSGLFLLGLMSDHFFGRPAAEGSWWANVLYAVTPNWQLFWAVDALDTSKAKIIPWAYVGKAFTYVAAYVGAALALAMMMFEDRELS
jgi:ABC-type transport system involved in multi-copper enzyme maturation permease subunit